MRKILPGALLALNVVFCSRAAYGAGPFPRLLPPAEELHLSLREEPRSKLPLGQSCGGEAAMALLCRAFTVTLENASAQTIRLSGLKCSEPSLTFERKESNSSSSWWPVSQPGRPTCGTLDWTNTRLRPGERTLYTTRLITSRRTILHLGTGRYTLRAEWTLVGCTEGPEGGDCLAPLQIVQRPGSPAGVDFQEPVTVYSNEITAESPELGELGGLKFGFEVTLAGNQGRDAQAVRTGSCAAASASVDCTVFHYVIQNLGDRPVRNATYSCSDSGIQPEYRMEGSAWQPVPSTAWVCSMNVLIEAQILPGGKLEGNFTLPTLRPGYDTASLQAPGEYQLRFTFWPQACVASPDASFCLTRPEKQPTITSKILTVRNIPSEELQN